LPYPHRIGAAITVTNRLDFTGGPRTIVADDQLREELREVDCGLGPFRGLVVIYGCRGSSCVSGGRAGSGLEEAPCSSGLLPGTVVPGLAAPPDEDVPGGRGGTGHSVARRAWS
jgi:hypothetical protein